MTRYSVTGHFVQLGRSSVSWKTKKQYTVSRSSAEAEYRTMANATSKVIWICKLLKLLRVPLSPAVLHCGNQVALHIALTPIFHERTKHIEVDCHFVCEKVDYGDIVTGYTHTMEQLANMFTKALGQRRFYYLLNKLGVTPVHAPT